MLSRWRNDLFDIVDGNGEADALAARIDGGVDADHLAAEVEERPAAVAGIDRGVGLDEVVVGARADGAAFGADDSEGDRVAEAERIADGDHVFADAERVARSERRGGEILGASSSSTARSSSRIAAAHFGVEFRARRRV